MKSTIEIHDFINCEALNNNFSYEGLVALFEHLEELEKDLGEEWDFDPIAIRCDFTEYKNIQSFWQDYDRYTYQCMNDIELETSVIYVDNNESFIIQNF